MQLFSLTTGEDEWRRVSSPGKPVQQRQPCCTMSGKLVLTALISNSTLTQGCGREEDPVQSRQSFPSVWAGSRLKRTANYWKWWQTTVDQQFNHVQHRSLALETKQSQHLCCCHSGWLPGSWRWSARSEMTTKAADKQATEHRVVKSSRCPAGPALVQRLDQVSILAV